MKTLLLILLMTPFAGRSQTFTGDPFRSDTPERFCANAFNQNPIVHPHFVMSTHRKLKQRRTDKYSVALSVPALSSAYTFKMCNLILEPNLLLGVSYARQKLLSQYGCYILDDISGSLAANHIQLNIGCRF